MILNLQNEGLTKMSPILETKPLKMTYICFGVEMTKRIQICKHLYQTIQPFFIS